MSRELESRNRAMAQLYATGKSYQDIGDIYGISRQAVAQIVARYFSDVAVSDDENRALHRAQLESIQNSLVAMFYEPPQPIFDVKGDMTLDLRTCDCNDGRIEPGKEKYFEQHAKTCNVTVIVDKETPVKLAKAIVHISESLRRQDALDKPRLKQKKVSEDMRQMEERFAEYIAQLPKAQVEEDPDEDS